MKAIFSIIIASIAFNAHAQQWTVLQSGTLNEFDAVLIDDENTYWVGGEMGLLLHTTDGGITWTTRSFPPEDIEDILRLDPTTLLIATDDGVIARSTDNGDTWTMIPTLAPNVLYALTRSGNNVWASGRDGGLVHSSDLGLTWTLQNSGTSERLHGIHALDDQIVVAVGREGVILRTNDGGNNWDLSIMPGGEDHRAVFFLDNAEQTGLIAGPAGEMLSSTDQGATWTSVSIPSVLEAQAIASEDPDMVYAVGNNALIMRSTDQGSTWETMSTTAFSELSGIDVKDGVAVAVGANGTILKLGGGVGLQENIQGFDGDLLVYPNPASGPVTVELAGFAASENEFTLEVLTVDGRLVDRSIWPAAKAKGTIQALDAGQYVVRLVGRNGSGLQRPVIITDR